MKILVAYASRAGSTRGIAEFIGEKLKARGNQVDVLAVESAEKLDRYDAFVIGSAVYQYHWLKAAKEFVSRNRSILVGRPVWVFSSGPTGLKATDSKNRDLREVSGPKEIDELREWIRPKDHRVFFGAFFPDKLTGAVGWFARRVPKDQVGDFRNWKEIETWTNEIANALPAVPA